MALNHDISKNLQRLRDWRLVMIGVGSLLDISGRATRRKLDALDESNLFEPHPIRKDALAEHWRAVGAHVNAALAKIPTTGGLIWTLPQHEHESDSVERGRDPRSS